MARLGPPSTLSPSPLTDVHIHVIPRFPGDIERNDDIYAMLEGKKEIPPPRVDVDAHARRDRTAEDMAAEAAEFRALMNELFPPPEAAASSL